jgi:hypothetical protein
MKRRDLDHLLRAAGEIAGHREFVLVGSAAIFAWHEHVPEPMNMSREVDLFASDVSREQAEEISDLLENIGHLSQFDDTHGYYVDGVSPETAILPPDWRDRSKTYASGATNGVTAIVPHPEDIAVSKLRAGRDKDVDWVQAAHAAGFIDRDRIAERIGAMPDLDDVVRARMQQLLDLATQP